MAEDRSIGSERQELRAERGVAQYQRLASLLRHRIAKGEYPLGAQLPPITQLADDLGVAVITVRQAYELLSREGLIRSQRGVGTHVAALPADGGRPRAGDQRYVRRAAGARLRDPRSAAPHRRAAGTARAGGPAGRRKRVRPQAAHLFRRAVLLCRDLRADGGLRIAAQGHRQEEEAARRGAR